ncbi:L-type lectin-domain containing protein [Cohnella xylanilytica]|uniref:L-type lectin-domain containing protein n=1 Tax=Cohnella xylanilytica TaxID=557555 RepID=UPI001BB30E5A|nr:L-type lectin-domain containing protein [Cohnella xylanilytica]
MNTARLKSYLKGGRSGKRWFNAAMALLIAGSGFAATPPGRASAADDTVTVDPSKTYISLKNADFGSANPLVGGAISWPAPGTPPSGSGLIQLGNALSNSLQYNYGVKSGGTAYSASDRQTPGGTIGFQNNGSRNIVRLATTKGNAFGSLFNKERVTLSDNRSFSTYFSFKMEGGIQADGIVFAIQTASNDAGASGGGLGYSGVQKSIGVEYDTYYNNGKDGTEDRSDPRPLGVTSGTRGSHVAVVLDGDVNHNSSNNGGIQEGRNIASLDIGIMSLAKTNTEQTNDPYSSFHSWIDYDGIKQQLRVYLIRENTDGTYWAPVVENGQLVTEGSGTGKRIKTVLLKDFPTLSGEDLVAPLNDGSGSFTIKPIIAENKDLSSRLLQDDAFIGFTAATGGAYQNHDIYSWYFNNYSGLIVPGAPSSTDQQVELAPTQISIEKGPLVYKEQNVNFELQDGKPIGTVPQYDGATQLQGIVATGSSAPVKAEVKTIDGKRIAGYPVTFSLYYIKDYTTVQIGSGRTVSAATQVDDEDLYLTAKDYSVKTSRYERNGKTVVVREITVPTDANGVATVDVWNLGDYPHLTNVKARIGGVLDGKTYGGGNFDTAPILFADPVAPKVVKAEVGPDRHTVDVTLDMPVDYDPTKTGGFYLDISGGNGDPVLVPLKVADHAKDASGEDDPFRLKLEIDPDAQDYPKNLPRDYVIPPNTNPPLIYDQDKGSVKGAGLGGLPLESFPVAGDPDSGVPVQNRFAPQDLEVVNDQDRNKIEIEFPAAIEAPTSAVLSAFTVTIDDSSEPPKTISLNNQNAVIEFDPTHPDKLTIQLTNGDKIPLNAKVSLTYAPELLNDTDRIVKIEDGSKLDAFVNDPVRNQMKPVSAAVVDDSERNKVKVVFEKPLDADAVSKSANAFSFNIDGIDQPIPAIGASLDGTDPTNKTVILTLGNGLPAGGVPVLPSNAAKTNITLNYETNKKDSSDKIINVRETGADARSLGWLNAFEVVNQKGLNPTAAAVASDRNKVIVKFPEAVTVTDSPKLEIVIDTGDGDPKTVAATVKGGSATNTLTLQLADDVQVPPGAKVSLNYAIDSSGSIVSSADPQLVQRPLTGFPVSNVFVTIDSPANGSTVAEVRSIKGASEPGSNVEVQVTDSSNEIQPELRKYHLIKI